MSQRRQKKQLSILDNVSSLTDHELREALKGYMQAPGPITDSTRNLYRKKLASLMEAEDDDNDQSTSLNRSQSKPLGSAALLTNTADDLADEDTSDEDYNAQDEETEEEEETEVSEDDESEEEDLEAFRGDIKMSNTSDNLSTSVITGPDAAPNRISRNILILLVSFFVAIFSFYLYSRNDYKLSLPLQPFKNITKQLLVLLVLSPIGYFAYRTIRYYRQRRHQEMQRVCELVDEALELLQSPDNPKGLMPILHIRDTLLTPAERKTKKMTGLWTKAVKFIEEHESRVKVELVNIDGEDFRAWKWIGSRKL